MPPKGRKKAAAAVGYQHTDEVPAGTVLTALNKKQWRVGKPVGQGGFGVLYLATPADQPKAEPLYVLKLEPHSNGPLFCEMHFYLRCAKPEMIDAWLKSRKMKKVGIPKYIGHGAHHHNGENRFLVMERFGTDLQHLFVAAGKRFHKHTVYKVAVKMIDALEYIHSKGYVHADIKAANILLGHTNNDEVYLVDYGLAARYLLNDSHIEYKPEPKSCHNGTIEFTSRDAHDGVAPSRRGDMEILGYCLLQWLCSKLPWEDKLSNKDYVKTQKNKAMDDVPGLMKRSFGSEIPVELQRYLEHVASLSYPSEPDYDHLRSVFNGWLKKNGHASSGLDFSGASMNGHAKAQKRPSIEEFSSPPPPQPAQKRPRKPASSRKPKTADDSITPRGKKTKIEKDDSPIRSPSPKKTKTKVKSEDSLSLLSEDGSLGVTPLSPVERVKVKVEGEVRRSPRRRVERVTKDVYSPPVKERTVPRRKPCKNPVDVACQTSPWLKHTIKRTKKHT